MPAKPFKISESLSTEDIPSANPIIIARILSGFRIREKHIYEFISGLLQDVESMDDPELKTMKIEKIKLIRELIILALSLNEDKSPEEYPEMPYSNPELQPVIMEDPAHEESGKPPPDYTSIIPGSNKKRERYIN